MKKSQLFLGIPPIIYLTLNKTFRSETRKLFLKLLCVNVENLSHQTLIELNVDPIQNNNCEKKEIIAQDGILSQQNIHAASKNDRLAFQQCQIYRDWTGVRRVMAWGVTKDPKTMH